VKELTASGDHDKNPPCRESLFESTPVRVTPNVAKKVLSVKHDLAQLGVEVHQVDVAYEFIKEAVEVAGRAWLAYSIMKEAMNQWPKIREVLRSAGLSDSQIITLDLAKHTMSK